MNYHLIGLGGIGMSALARILVQKGDRVQGSDASESPLLDQLRKEGVSVWIGHDPERVQPDCVVVRSTDVKDHNVEIARAKELQIPILHRSDLLDQLLKEKKSLLVTGTHGKTTTTSLLAAVMIEAGLDPSFAIGGILLSENTNGRAGKGDYFVAESDESDGSFLKTPSFGAIVTNLENDHLDYWQTEKKLDAAFAQFFSQVKKEKHLFWCADDPRLCVLKPKGTSYGFSEKADLRISRFRTTEKGILFDLGDNNKIELSLFGRHNALNGAAVFGLARSLGIAEEAIRSAFKKFRGTARRLEKKWEENKTVLFDDYGHHPTEIGVTLRALRERIRERRMVVVFQPHRYTRVRDLFDEFTTCFSDADLVAMTDIYSAREAPIEGITSSALFAKMREKLGGKTIYLPRASLESEVARLLKPLDVVLTLGAGDVTRSGSGILEEYRKLAPKWRVGVICGGTSAEHPVSLMSTKKIVENLDRSSYEVKLFGITKKGEWITGDDTIEKLEKKSGSTKGLFSHEILKEIQKCDLCIPVLHGPQGEDGMIPALLDTFQIPYAGCDYRSGPLCMQKAWTKQMALIHNVPTPPFFEMDLLSYRKNPSELLKKIAERLRYPVWIKPVHLGSSIGVGRADSPEEVESRAELAFYYDDAVIVEQHIEGRQIEFSLLGNETVRVSTPGEVLTGGAFLDYELKYGKHASPIQIPPKMSEMDQELGQELATKMYQAAGCKGLARIDFFFDTEGHYWFNEINPFPGFTPTSAFPQMWEKSGMTRSQINDELIALALQRSRRLMEIRGR